MYISKIVCVCVDYLISKSVCCHTICRCTDETILYNWLILLCESVWVFLLYLPLFALFQQIEQTQIIRWYYIGLFSIAKMIKTTGIHQKFMSLIAQFPVSSQIDIYCLNDLIASSSYCCYCWCKLLCNGKIYTQKIQESEQPKSNVNTRD